MPQIDSPEGAGTSRLASLRRLYHHVIQGGPTTPRDAAWLGEPVTLDSLARQIRELERQTMPLDRLPERMAG